MTSHLSRGGPKDGFGTLETFAGKATITATTIFLDALLPPMHPEIDLQATIDAIQRNPRSVQRLVMKSGCVWGYNKATPSQSRYSGKESFRPLYVSTGCAEAF